MGECTEVPDRKMTFGKAGYGTLKDIERLYTKALRDTAKSDAKKQASGVFTKASAAEISTEEYLTELGRKLHAKEITGEEFDRLYSERVSKDKTYRDLIDADARKTMGFTDRTDAADVNQEKRFDVEENAKDYFVEDKYFKSQMTKWEDLKYGSYVKVGTIGSKHPLHLIGMPTGTLRYDVSKIEKNMHDHTDYLTVDLLNKIPEIIAEPIAISEYGQENTVSVFGNIFVGNSPMMVGVTISKDRAGNDINKIRTYNTRRDVGTLINDKTVLFLNENKKRTREWFQACGIQVPLGGTKFGFIRSISQSSDSVNKQFSVSDEEIKSEQLRIIEEANPAPNSYSTWIRSADDIKTLGETLEDSDWADVDSFNPDLTREDILKAIDRGSITVYSSYPIENGVFVSPSYMEASSYSGDGQVYAKSAYSVHPYGM